MSSARSKAKAIPVSHRGCRRSRAARSSWPKGCGARTPCAWQPEYRQRLLAHATREAIDRDTRSLTGNEGHYGAGFSAADPAFFFLFARPRDDFAFGAELDLRERVPEAALRIRGRHSMHAPARSTERWSSRARQYPGSLHRDRRVVDETVVQASRRTGRCPAAQPSSSRAPPRDRAVGVFVAQPRRSRWARPAQRMESRPAQPARSGLGSDRCIALRPRGEKPWASFIRHDLT